MAINFFNSLSVDTDVLYVDAVNNRVGIGTNTPDTGTNLHVLTGTGSGQIKLSSQANTQFQFYGDGNQDINYGKPANFPDPGGDAIGQIRYNHGSNYMAFKVNNAEMVRFASNNYVGIGTTSPASPLHLKIVGTGGSNVLSLENGSNKYDFRLSGSSLLVRDGSNDRIALDSSGNVGIGTTSPAEKLDVSGTIQSSANEGKIIINSTATNGKEYQLISIDTGNLGLFDGTAYRLWVAGSGNIGIGTTSPSTKLHLSDTSDSIIRIQRVGVQELQLNSDGTVTAASTDLKLVSTGNISFTANSSERMRIDSSGNVSIGDSSARNARLLLNNAGSQGAPQLMLIDSGDSGKQSEIRFDSGNLIFDYWSGSSRSERMRIGPAGQIGIGGANYGTSGQVLTSNGSGSAPSWQNAGAGSSNWTLSGNDIYNNNSGNVGIGTSSPSSKAHIKGALRLEDSTDTTTRDHILNVETSGALSFTDSVSGERMRLDYNGNVGINTTSPSSKLHVQNSAGGSGGYLKITDATYGGDVRFGMADGVNNDVILGSWTNNSILFYTNTAERVRITNTGNVGIGTTSPTTGKLVVHSGDIEVRDSTGNSGGRIKSYDDHHAIYFREGGNNQINYYEYGGNVSAGGGHRFFTGGTKPNQTLKVHIGDDYTQINNSTRSPIFYDSNNTGRYIDPSSTSRINRLEIENTSDQNTPTAYMQIGSDGFQFGGNNNGYEINSAQISAGYHTANSLNFVGMGTTSPSRRMDFWAEGGFFVSGDIYDKDYTSYYLSPGGSSRLHSIVVGDGTPDTTPDGTTFSNTIKSTNGSNRVVNFEGAGSSISTWYTVGNTAYGAIDQSSSYMSFWQNQGLGWQEQFRIYRGYQQSLNSLRAPIFYDSDNTGYYVNPASGSQFSDIYYNAWLRNNRTASSSGLYWESGTPGAGWHIYPLDQSDMYIRAGSGNGSLRFTTGNETARGYVHWTGSNEVGFLNSGRSWSLRVDNSGNTFATTSHRAPIFYDSNNTAYYTDPAGTTNIQHLIVNTYGSGISRQLTIKEDGDSEVSMGNYPGAWTSALNIQSNDNSTYLWLSPLTSNIPRVQTNYGQLDFYTGNNTNRALHLSGTTARSSTFYDIDNTSYYVDPASTSNLEKLQVDGLFGSSVRRITNPGGATYLTTASSVTGGLLIQLPTARRRSNTMMQMTINVYQYNTGRSFQLRVGGYNYNNTNSWVNVFAYLIGDQSFPQPLNVRFGDDGTRNWIMIGETNTVWSYPQFQVTDFQAGYSGVSESWSDGWATSIVTSIPSGHDETRVASSALTSNNASNWSTALYAPIYYDSNDTGFYLNPADSASRLGGIFFGKANNDRNGMVPVALNDGQLLFRTNTDYNHKMWYYDGLNFSTNPSHGHIRFWADSSSRTNSTGGTTLVLDSDCQNVYTTIYGSTRSPIFYDSNNTSYYVDPASGSVLSTVALGTSISGAPSFTRLKIKGSGNGGCALFIEGAGYTSNVKMTLPTYGAGIYIDNVGALGVNALYFARNGTNAGEIVVNTGLTTNYNTTSDYRLKENVVELTNGIEKVKQLKPKRFNFILDENKEIIDGFIAHEAKEVVPGSVTGEKDGVLPNGDPDYQGMDNSKLVPVLTAALQEAIAKIEDLETRIQILENQ